MAADLGFASADHLLDQLSPAQWAEWIVVTQLRPIGQRHRDEVQASLMRITAQIAGWQVDVRSLMAEFGYRGQLRQRSRKPESLDEARRRIEAESMLFSNQLHS